MARIVCPECVFARHSRLNGDQELSQERRLVYRTMTRSREHLYLCYQGKWPEPLQGVVKYVD